MPGPLASPHTSPAAAGIRDELFDLPYKEAKNRLLEDFQSQFIMKALTSHGGNVSQTAREVGVKRQYLHRLIREANLDTKILKRGTSADDSTREGDS
jgi:DNA-binding NtrC family response regulator